MKLLKYSLLVILSSLSIHSTSFAQSISNAELWERGEVSMHGFHPTSLETLVGSSKIIVKGKFVRFLKSELFFGYDHTRESYGKAHGIDEADLDEWGIPVSDFEIAVNEVLLGDKSLASGSIIFRLAESTLVENHYINDTEERLFFLAPNPDGSYSALGPESVQILRGDRYEYDSLVPHPEEFTGRTLEFVDSTQVDNLEKEILLEIQRQN